MAQQNLYRRNPNDVRVGHLAYDGATTLSKKTFKFTFISLVCLRVKLMQLKPYKFTSV